MLFLYYVWLVLGIIYLEKNQHVKMFGTGQATANQRIGQKILGLFYFRLRRCTNSTRFYVARTDRLIKVTSMLTDR